MNRNMPVGEGYVHVDQKLPTKAQHPSVGGAAAVAQGFAGSNGRIATGIKRITTARDAGSGGLRRISRSPARSRARPAEYRTLEEAHAPVGRMFAGGVVNSSRLKVYGEPNLQRRGGGKSCLALARQEG